ncbi:SNF2 family N-terminal domain, partial [Musa troglodytarum]
SPRGANEVRVDIPSSPESCPELPAGSLRLDRPPPSLTPTPTPTPPTPSDSHNMENPNRFYVSTPNPQCILHFPPSSAPRPHSRLLPTSVIPTASITSACRLRQRKVVNIHRLIMHAALEEEVMSLQKSKVTFADDVIDAENAILKTMNTDQLLNLFCFFTNRSNVMCLKKHGEGNSSFKQLQ